MFGQSHIVAASHIDQVTKGPIIQENENEKLMQLVRDLENCGMNLNKLVYQSDVNSTHNISAIVLCHPKYLRSEWAKEANNLRGQSKEPNFAALTKFVVNKAKLANTEYGRLVNLKNDWDRSKPKSYDKPTKNVAAYQVSSCHQNEEQDGKGNPVMKSTCIFCHKDGHSLGRCFMFQKKSNAERKRFIREKGLCNLCLSKGHFASKCQRGRNCFVDGCSRRHHPLLHSSELKQSK